MSSYTTLRYILMVLSIIPVLVLVNLLMDKLTGTKSIDYKSARYVPARIRIINRRK